MSQRVIKFFKAPAFTADIWSARNPYLRSGEIGYVLQGGIVIGGKVGPGYWNDLNFLGEDIYQYAEAPTNPIGDAQGVLQGLTVSEILNKMLNPYQAPAFSNITNNAAGSFINQAVREIGQTVNGPVQVNYSLSNAGNLVGATPINVLAGGTFSNEGNFSNSGSIILSLTSPLAPIAPQTITITLRATHQNGQTGGSTTQIHFRPRIMWVSSQSANLNSGSEFMSLIGRQNTVSSDYKLEYSFPGNGYSWIAIPSMLSPSNLIFTDVTDPLAPANYAMQQYGSFSINNGVGTYTYILYRSTFNLINPTKLRIQ